MDNEGTSWKIIAAVALVGIGWLWYEGRSFDSTATPETPVITADQQAGPAAVQPALQIIPSTTVTAMIETGPSCTPFPVTVKPRHSPARRAIGFLPGLVARPFRKGAPPAAEPLIVEYEAMPRYPSRAITQRTQGSVRLCAAIDPRGTVRDVRVLDGPPALRSAAVEAMRQWQYRPFVPAEGEDAAWSEVTLRFMLTVGE